MAERAFWGLGVACVLSGCADADPSYDARLADLAPELSVSVDVLGTRDPATPRRVSVLLGPGPSATIDQDHLCPVIEARASLNGLALDQTQKGEYFFSSGSGFLSSSAGCYPIVFERELPEELPAELLEEPTRLEVRDESGLVLVEARGLFIPARANFLEPADGVMSPGALVSLSIEPSPKVLPPRLNGYYRAEVPGDSFGLGPIDITDTGITFRVSERAVPSSGRLELEGDQGPFRGIVDVCQGAAHCAAARSICSESFRCTTGVAYGDGFDSLVLPASVTVED